MKQRQAPAHSRSSLVSLLDSPRAQEHARYPPEISWRRRTGGVSVRDKLKFFANEPVRGLREPVFLRLNRPRQPWLYPILLVRFTLHARCNSAPAISAVSRQPATHLKSPIYWTRELLIFLPYKGLASVRGNTKKATALSTSSGFSLFLVTPEFRRMYYTYMYTRCVCMSGCVSGDESKDG